jgi:hypothetical protein
MNRAFREGYLRVDFPVEPFHSVPRLLLRSASVFFRDLRFVALVTLTVFLPVKAAIQWICWLADVPTGGTLMYLLLDASDLVLAACVTPAVVYGLLARFRGAPMPPLAEALRWGRRQWGKCLWNRFKAEVIVMMYSLLLLVPGLIKMVRLAFTDPVVAIEGDREDAVLDRSNAIGDGHRWQIFLVLLPVSLVELAGTFLIFGSLPKGEYSRPAIAIVDSLLSVGGQWGTVVSLLMYLGLTAPARKAS